ncbi:8-amino-7-oxononanoate synthase [Akkermansiaceae bacterium]|nr:8-amino-7-oxononanoate synthase [Akkermansiaceae bacterium]
MDPRRQLGHLTERNLLRSLSPGESKGLRITRDGRELWNFASNDYLGLSHHPDIAAAFAEGIARYGTGAGASRLVTGSSHAHTALEEGIAAAKHSEAALTFSSGYATALSAIPVICGKGDFIVLDKLAHACLIDAARMSAATLRAFPHNDTDKLARLLAALRAKHPSARLLVATESVFSMDGDLCPLRELLDICEFHGAELLLDEAHALGVLGPTGMGLAEKLGVQHRVHFQMGTLSKALGLSGGYLAASRDWMDLIINRARPFIYTTAPAPALAHAAIAALGLVRSAGGKRLREKLFRNVSLLRPNHPSAILPLIIGESAAALSASAGLAEEGFLAPAIRYPTVPRNTARLRITLSAGHPEEAVRGLAAVLGKGFR